MTSPRVLCLGEILFDYLADQSGRSRDRVESWTPYPGGAPANVACGLVKLGTPAGFIGCIGQDAAGDELVALLEAVGVDTQGVQRHPSAPTRQVYVTRSEAGERYFAGFGDTETSEFADTCLAAEGLPESLFREADYLVLGTLGLAYPQTRQAIYKALELAQQYQLSVFVDINWRPVFWLDPHAAPPLIHSVLKQAHWLKCSDEEANWLFGTDDPTAIARQVQGLQGVLVTAGERGCAYQLGQHVGKVGGFKITAADTTGAGDGFVAGFLHQCCTQGSRILENPEQARAAVTYASAVGALVATQPGAIAAQPTAQEVESFLIKLNHQ